MEGVDKAPEKLHKAVFRAPRFGWAMSLVNSSPIIYIYFMFIHLTFARYK